MFKKIAEFYNDPQNFCYSKDLTSRNIDKLDAQYQSHIVQRAATVDSLFLKANDLSTKGALLCAIDDMRTHCRTISPDQAAATAAIVPTTAPTTRMTEEQLAEEANINLTKRLFPQEMFGYTKIQYKNGFSGIDTQSRRPTFNDSTNKDVWLGFTDEAMAKAFCTALLEAGITNAKGGLKNPGKLTSDNGYEVRLSPANVVQMQQTERGKALPQAVQHVGHGH